MSAAQDIEQLQEHLLSCEIPVAVTDVSGSPASRFTARYTLSGLIRESSGAIVVATEFEVVFSLLFGYPHLPPRCQPTSAIFHPLVDEAIAIQSFWQTSKDLTELVLYVGKIISWQVVEDAEAAVFNPAAVEWYKENPERIPVDSVELELSKRVTIDRPAPSPAFGITLISGIPVSTTTSGSVTEQRTRDAELREAERLLETLRSFLQDRKYIAAEHFIRQNTWFATANLPEVTETQRLLESARLLFERASVHEQANEFTEALAIYEKICHDISDFPGLQEKLRFFREMYVSEVEKPASRAEPTSKKKLYAVVGALLGLSLVASVGVTVSHREHDAHQKAMTTLAHCKSLAESGDTESIRAACADAEKKIASLSFLRTERESLRTELTAFEASDLYKNGIQGRILVDGKYLSKAVVSEAEKLKTQMSDFAAAVEKQETALSIKLATELLESVKLVGASVAVDGLQEQLRVAQKLVAHSYVDKTVRLRANHDLAALQEHLEKSEAFFSTLPEELRAELSTKLQSSQQQEKLERYEDAGVRNFKERQWQTAEENFLRAAQIATAANLPKAAEFERYRALAEMNRHYDAGSVFFSAQNWEKAVVELQLARKVLDTLPPETIKKELRFECDVKYASASVKKLFAEAVAAASSGRYTEALAILRKARETAEQSSVAAQLLPIREEIRVTEAKYSEEAVLTLGTQYLKDHFREIYNAHYRSGSGEVMKDPKVKFVKHEGNRYVFSLTCLESRGASYPVEIFYAYDSETRNWSFHKPPSQ